MPFKLTVLGCSSAIPNINHNPTAQLLNLNERFFLIDCGEGTQIQLRKYKINFQRINHIFISHLHGDHYFGLIGLISSMHLLGRKKELHIYAHEKLKKIIEYQLSASNTELNYPLFFHPISELRESILFEDDMISVENVILDHTLPCSGFIFKEKKSARKIKPKVIEQMNIPHDKLNSIKNGADWINLKGEVVKNKDMTYPNSPPNTYAFCTDTRYTESIIPKIKGIDLLYHEATFKNDMLERAFETGHSTTQQASYIANKACVKHLMIGHFSQRYKKLDELLLETQKVFKNTILAEAGMTIDFSNLTA